MEIRKQIFILIGASLLILTVFLAQDFHTLFKPEALNFYNPVTEEEGGIYVNSMRNSSFFLHNDIIELQVQVKTNLDQVKAGVSLSLYYSSQVFVSSVIDKRIIVNETERKIVTDKEGIAKYEFQYDQNDWRGHVSFHFTSQSLINKTARSESYQFNFRQKSITRSTNSSNDEIFSIVENKSLIEESFAFSIDQNDYSDFWDLKSTIINQSTLEYFSNVLNSSHSYYVTLKYEIRVLEVINLQNLSYSTLQSTWNTTMGVYYIGLSLIQTVPPLNEWYWTSGPLNEVNISSGWIILQKLSYSRSSGPLNGSYIDVNQIVILNEFFTVNWLSSTGHHIMS